jgi:adenosylcobinamide-GDP ribazoletransferase
LGFLAALQFLTILPIRRNFTVLEIGRSSASFPLIGLLIGLFLAGISLLLDRILPSSVVNVILVAGLAICSGALHLDGLADTLDGIAGHRTPEQRLEIMRDSRIGGFGAIGVALFLIIEYVLLDSLTGSPRLFALILAPALSRWSMVDAIFAYPYARTDGLGKAYKDSVRWPQMTAATAVAIAVSILLFKISGLVIIAANWIIITLLANFLKNRLNGLTGDTYGAINEIATASVFLLVILMVYNHWLI